MKNQILLIIAVMTLTLLVGCQRNQTVNTSKDEFSKDSCMIVTYADDTVEYRYQLKVDSFSEIKMLDSVQRVFISDIKKHGPFNNEVRVTYDLYENCRGKSFEVCDYVNYKLYRFQFAKETPSFILSDKINPNFGDIVDVNLDIEIN